MAKHITKEFLKDIQPPFGAYIVENTWMGANLPSSLSGLLDKGWGNGYIIIPHDHPWYLWIMKDNDEFVADSSDEKLNELATKYHNSAYDMYQIGVEVHGGVTFGHEVKEINENLKEDEDHFGEEEQKIPIEGYVIGFDSMHYQDNMDNWPKSRVETETRLLLQQAIAAYKPGVIAERLPDYIND